MPADTKPDQSDLLTELSGMKALLSPLKLSLPDLISQHASLAAGKLTLESDVAKLKGDNSKLVAGATLPTDLVSAANDIAALTKERDTLKAEKTTLDAAVAANDIAALTKERDTLKAEKTTLDAAVAAKVAALGIKDTTKPGETAPASGKKLSLDEEAAAFLKANPAYVTSPNLVQSNAAK